MLIDSGSTKFPGIIGIHGTITLKNLENNLGLIPMKLGTAKITKNCHSILYFYDVNLIITEVNDLKKKTENVATLSRKYIEHYKHSANYLNVLYFLERKVDGKLNDIFPSSYETVPSFSVRIKRGLINGLGSIFKAITGNLDASDGEKFESLISDLQNDQNKLSEAINSQNTLSVELIDNFNKTMHIPLKTEGVPNAAYHRLVQKYKNIDPNANRDIVVKKINNLRTAYKKELNKIKKSHKSGAGTDEIYTPHLWYFELLSFLYDQEVPGPSISNMDEDENEAKENCVVPLSPLLLGPASADWLNRIFRDVFWQILAERVRVHSVAQTDDREGVSEEDMPPTLMYIREAARVVAQSAHCIHNGGAI
ncbi:unnamed protein product [Acanthoscelides obtectus]|uniref:MADF domain-containing protein n=1 Tax=Acanthoscelides obtectus TaxID=200917 RepID=A0A9P0PLQ4_ACAOB|nr:unnamed protein product [Acanthoscelides obtectus]CAK1654588.1 hypothetical protein AOBTE_LOCUS18696 [Acanthoscelides obtectus]